MTETLELVIHTPSRTVVQSHVRSARIPTESGQMGLRRGTEPMVTVVEPGLCIVRSDVGTRFLATAGGLLEVVRERAVIYTPFFALGEAGEQVLRELDRALELPNGDLAARQRLGELEQHIVQELREHPSAHIRSHRHD